ncbi:MAG: response regulator [Dissulfurispiraceae bacterium]
MKPFKALLVDDDAGVRVMLRFSLERKFPHISFTECDDGKDALLKISENHQFVLSDWDMPNMDGLELLRALRGSPRFKQTPFVMITSTIDAESVLQSAGVTAYITKPFATELLFATVEQVIGTLDRRELEMSHAEGPVDIYADDMIRGNAVDISAGSVSGQFTGESLQLTILDAYVTLRVSLKKGKASGRAKGVARRVVKTRQIHNSQIAFQFMERQLSLL